MILKSINLQNFRNCQKKEFKFSSGTTLVVGPNTSGKTNLLEAIYLLASGRSFRAGVEKEMIRYDKEIARIKAGVVHLSARATKSSLTRITKPGSVNDSHGVYGKSGEKKTDRVGREFPPEAGQPLAEKFANSERIELEVILTTGQVGREKVAKKKYLVNGVSRRKMDFVGHLRVVYFGPEDLKIVVDSPSIRRDYLDSVLEQVDRDYRRASLSYQKGLRQRNRFLEQIRDQGRPKSALFFWNKLLIENGEIITRKREEFIDFVNSQPDYFYNLLASYQKSIISPSRLEKYGTREIAAGMTLIGPHRDDFRLRMYPNKNGLNKSEFGRDISIYGSRGEQRMAIFSLKLAELEFVAKKTQGRPVLLLDDIFSELDKERRKRLLEVIPKQQTIITTTELGLIEKKYWQKMKLIKL